MHLLGHFLYNIERSCQSRNLPDNEVVRLNVSVAVVLSTEYRVIFERSDAVANGLGSVMGSVDFVWNWSAVELIVCLWMGHSLLLGWLKFY